MLGTTKSRLSLRMEHWFQHSVKQLSGIQQQQVGLLVAAAVADAAARPLCGYSRYNLAEWTAQQRNKTRDVNSFSASGASRRAATPQSMRYSLSSSDSSPYIYGLSTDSLYQTEIPRMTTSEEKEIFHDTAPTLIPLAFANLSSLPSLTSVGHADSTASLDSCPADARDVDHDDDLPETGYAEEWLHTYHSYTYRLFEAAVRGAARMEGDVVHPGGLQHILQLWVTEAGATVSTSPQRVHGATDAMSSTPLASSTTGPEVFASEHQTLLHTLNAVLWVPVLYPFASDAVMHEFVLPLLDFLTTPAHREDDVKAGTLGIEREPSLSPSAPQPEKALQLVVHSCVLVVLSVLIRCLQSNPDPLRNTALQILMHMATEKDGHRYSFYPMDYLLQQKLHGTSAGGAHDASEKDVSAVQQFLMLLFPDDIRLQCEREASEPGVSRSAPSGDCDPKTIVADALAALFGAIGFRDSRLWNPSSHQLVEDILLIREALEVFHRFSGSRASVNAPLSVERSVEESIRLGCDVSSAATAAPVRHSAVECRSESTSRNPTRGSLGCHRAMLTGALMGATYGVRAISPRWISTTVDHVAVLSHAISIAQWSWNPSASRDE